MKKSDIPKPPALKKASIGQVLDWASSLKDLTLKSKAHIKLAELANSDRETWQRVRKGDWSSRKSIKRDVRVLDTLPHIERLEIKGQMIGKYLGSGEYNIPRLKDVAKMLGLRLEHVEFAYFTMPAKVEMP
jgi:hypothetical protein